jgi:hypothetical protein
MRVVLGRREWYYWWEKRLRDARFTAGLEVDGDGRSIR